MSDSTSSSDKSSSKSTESKSKDSGSTDSASSSGGAESGKSAKESIGGKSEIHYGFFSSVRTPEYRSGWDDIWGSKDSGNSGKKSAKGRSNGKSKATSAAKSTTVELGFADLPDEVRDGLMEAARKKMRKSRANLDKLDAAGKIDWSISVTANGGRG